MGSNFFFLKLHLSFEPILSNQLMLSHDGISREVLVLVKDLMAADACRDVVSSTVAHFECNFYLVQLIRTTNTNPQYLQRIFVYLLFDYFYQVKIFTQDKDTPKNAYS